MTTIVLRRASLGPDRGPVDIAVRDGVLVDPADVPAGAEEVDLDGRPVLPGLADHHVHLFALAAARASVDLSPEALAAGGGLDRVLVAARARTPGGWLRGVGYDVATSGPLDRHRLDATGAGPMRVQDRTGILWVLDGPALAEVLPADARDVPDGVELVDGRPTGVLVRLDHWLGHRVPTPPMDLAAVGAELAASGVVVVMDAGADNDAPDLAALAAADLPVGVAAMTRDVVARPVGSVALGPVKVLLDDTDLPDLAALSAHVAAAHAAGRGVAVHCVSEVQLALALAAGIGPADRVEHASMLPDGLLAALAAAGPQVVVQPALVWARGDRFLAETDPADHAALHRLGALRRAGVRVAASSDAPFGPVDPWRSIATAVDRRTRTGASLGPDEAVTPLEALALHTGRVDDPAIPRRLVPGEPADLVVLDDDWSALATHPRVAATARAGRLTHGHWPA
ncbi:MAG TPA: amidohydrolase family protein [Iamia sp.]|nr:amidohydrolase family protein [Iamia sp.]